MTARKPEKPDMDLISMVQRARMAHDDTAQPSKAAAAYWIEAKNQHGDTLQPTARSGEWCITTTVQQVDSLWATIKAATEAGQLGFKSKVSTSAVPGQKSLDARMICVRTVDSADAADVARVEQALRDLGVAGEMAYRTDASARPSDSAES